MYFNIMTNYLNDQIVATAICLLCISYLLGYWKASERRYEEELKKNNILRLVFLLIIFYVANYNMLIAVFLSLSFIEMNR